MLSFASKLTRRAVAASVITAARQHAALLSTTPKIIYTITDEAPALATYALLPILKRFTVPYGIDLETSDISVAARILAQFPDRVSPPPPDCLAELGELAKTPEANIIKLPNVSASVPQLLAAIEELQGQGYDIPDYPANPKTDEERDIAERYGRVLGSAVNPVLREGNSDRRVAAPVKAYAQKNPHRMGSWTSDSKSHVAHMDDKDFFSSEQSAVCAKAGSLKITLDDEVLKEAVPVQKGEVVDASVMNVEALREFFAREIADAKEKDMLFSLHLKATMMKVSDPIMFGHCVEVFFADVFEKHGDALADAGVNTKNGLGDVYEKIAALPESKRAEIEADMEACLENGPRLAMVDSGRGITNLHVPSDVIIDASMPVVVRDSGMMWNKDNALEECKATIPDRSYAGVYKRVIDFCKENGQFDVATMGNVSNVGLMAQKAEEYGSHDKTFEIPRSGTVRVTDADGNVVFEHAVEKGDIWRMAQTKDEPIRDWVRLAVSRARATGAQTIFWLNENRAHDASLIGKVNEYIKDHDTSGLDISIASPEDAVWTSMENAKAGRDTISVTGNVLRDYLTDLFPILELGTSAKMLSIVPLLKGGGLFETGAGGSAPKHVQQFVEEGHLRWDSLGEYLAMGVALETYAENYDSDSARTLGETLNEAVGKLLDERKSPSRTVNELDNRGSSFYVATYWAEAMARRDASFQGLADELKSAHDEILSDLIDCQGHEVDIGGYFKPDPAKCETAMRPSATLNRIIDAIP